MKQKNLIFLPKGKWTRMFLSLVIFMVLMTGMAFAQQKTLTGKVTDETGSPTPGVSVIVKGTATGTTTNNDGNYTLNVPSSAQTLTFSFIGMVAMEIPIGQKTVINVVMRTETVGVDEVVVVGYTTQKRGSITGAVSSIKSEELVKSPSVAATSALVGKLAGITSRTYDSRPGNGAAIQIRNLGNPLYVIDGVPYSTSDGTTGFGFNTNISGQNVFNNLGLEDIESISVLKDASASVYGLRASNGVVLVTTKQGSKTEAPTINVTGYAGVQNFTRYYDVANAGQYVTALVQSNQNLGQNPSYTKEELAKWVAGTEKGYKSYNYKDIVIRPNVPQSYISVNASGGSERTKYYFSVSNLGQDALLKEFSFNRMNLQSNISTKLAKGLTIGTQISGRLEKRKQVGVPGLDDYFNPLLSITSMWPTESPYANDNPLYINQTHNVNVNPATYSRSVTGWIDEISRAVNVNLNAQYDFSFGLTAKGVYSYNFTNEDFDGFEYTYPAYIYNATTDTYADRPAGGAPYGNQNPWREIHKRNVISRFAQAQLSYTKKFGDHGIDAVAAYERSDMENKYIAIHSIPPNNYIPTIAFANQDYLGYDWGIEARAGYAGRINYNYKQKYLLELLGRYDGTFMYRSDKRWGFFPGASLGWRISEEKFVKDATGSFLSNLKLRASYGETGSEVGVSAFNYLPGYNFNSGNAVFDGNYVIGLQPRGLPITNLSWVKNQTSNIGIDFTVLGDKLVGQFDVFNRKRSGLPAAKYDVLLPSEVGYTLPNENLTSDATRGFEGQLTYSSKIGKVNYSLGGNFTVARRKDLSFYKPRFGNSWDEYRTAYTNRWGNINWGYQVIGQFQSQQQIDAYTVNNDGQGNRSELPGDFIFKDVNNDGIINSLDNRPIGYAEGATPYMNYGILGSISYKGFSLSFNFMGATMQSFYRNVELKFPFQNNGNSANYMLTDVWHHSDPYDITSPWIPGKYPALRKDLNSHVNYARSDVWVTNVNYFRLKNLELGYDLPKKLIAKVGIAKLRIFANGSNLFSIDNMKGIGIDPEISSNGGLVYPQQRLFNIGFNLTL